MTPRPKRSFQTILDAHKLIGGDRGQSHVTRSWTDDMLRLEFEHHLNHGRVSETIEFDYQSGDLRTRRLVRTVHDGDDQLLRSEDATFGSPTIELPEETYPEVALPFILGAMVGLPGTSSFYAWINDRFVAKVYFERDGESEHRIGGERRRSIEAVMYPDLNDWVPLPRILTRLAKPFVPKYHMSFDKETPHRLLRFEGPYGPPGAPEVVLQLEP